MRRRGLCAALALCLLLPGCAAPVQKSAEAAPAPAPLTLPESVTEPEGFALLPVYLDGLLLGRAYEREGALYIALRPLCEYADIPMDWSGSLEDFELSLGGLEVKGEAELSYFTASGRYLYAPERWLLRGGELYLPEWALCKLLNLSAERGDGAVRLDGSRLRLLEGGENYYDLNFPYEDVHWLSHIIGSEAGIEPMEGKIGVGNVVLNRVKDPDFPDTVFEVVYDYEHTVQFEPVSKGTIHDDPRPLDIIAAYLVLEGANTAGDCLYFVNPDFGSFWFDNNLQFVMKLGRHNFYIRGGNENAGTTGTDPAAGS